MAKHTPGPWRECRAKDCECGYIFTHWDSGKRDLIAVAQALDLRDDMEQPTGPPGAKQANARLIAAAPRMLELLEGWHQHTLMYAPNSVQTSPFIEEVEQLLREVRGE